MTDQELRIRDLENTVRDLTKDERIFIPGTWRCAKCNFVLQRTSINASTGDFGTTMADREDSEPCPNDGNEMVRVSWKERCTELAALATAYCLSLHRVERQLEIAEQHITDGGYARIE